MVDRISIDEQDRADEDGDRRRWPGGRDRATCEQEEVVLMTSITTFHHFASA